MKLCIAVFLILLGIAPHPARADELPFFNQPVVISTQTATAPLRHRIPGAAGLERQMKKYRPNPRVQNPYASPMPPNAPKLQIPRPSAQPSAAERFFGRAAKILTSTWDSNIFVWLPAIATDPNTGPTYGLLPVLVLSEPVHHHIQQLYAPSYTYNSFFGQTGTMRYYYYPDDASQLYMIGSYSEHTNREIKVRYQDTAALDGTAFIYGEGSYNIDGSPRFFGFGPETHAGDETGYTAKDTFARGNIGLNFLGAWRASTGIRFRHMGVDPTTLPNTKDLITTFPTAPGIGTSNTVAYEFRLLMDTRDYPVTPSRGSACEIWFEKTFKTLGSDSEFIRYGAEGNFFFPWDQHPDQVTVVHGLYEWVNGPFIPFYEMTSLGGRETLRGFGEGRFTDRGRILFNLEQRMRIASLSMMGIQTNFEIAPFFDLGTVFPTLPQIQRRLFRPVYGAAFRAAVKPNVVGSVDVGISNEGPAVYVGINYPF